MAARRRARRGKGAGRWALAAALLAAVALASAPLYALVGQRGAGGAGGVELAVPLAPGESLTLYVIDEAISGGNVTVIGSEYVTLSVLRVGYPYSVINVSGSVANVTTLTLAVPPRLLGSQRLGEVEFADFLTGAEYAVNLTFYSFSNGKFYYTYDNGSLIVVATYGSDGRLDSYAIYKELDGVVLAEVVQVVGYSYSGPGVTTVTVPG